MNVTLAFLFGAIALPAFAQDGYGSTSVYDRVVDLPAGKHFFILPPMEDWERQNWADSVYQFPAFETGRIQAKSGFILPHRPQLNYNILLQSIDMLDAAGKKVVMKKSQQIRSVFIGEHQFLSDRQFGYIEIILWGKVSVARKTLMKAIYEVGNGSRYPIEINDVATIPRKGTIYYWIDEQYFIIREVKDDLKPFRAGPQVLNNAYPKQRKKIQAFAKSNRIDYSKKEDILKIVAYANQEDATEN